MTNSLELVMTLVKFAMLVKQKNSFSVQSQNYNLDLEVNHSLPYPLLKPKEENKFLKFLKTMTFVEWQE